MDTIGQIIAGILLIACGITTLRLNRTNRNLRARNARLLEENKAAGLLVSVFTTSMAEDTRQIFSLLDQVSELEKQNSAMWNFIRRDVPMPEDVAPVDYALNEDVPFDFFDSSHQAALRLVETELGGTVIEHDDTCKH